MNPSSSPFASWRAFKWSILARHDGYPDFNAYRTLLRQETMSVSEMAALRCRKTRHLVRECLRHIPYYGDLLRSAGITPERVRGPEDLEVLPLLTKHIIRAQQARMLNGSADSADYFPHATSGSTGMPLNFFRGRDYDRVANAAANMRSWTRMGWRPGDPMVRFWMAHPGPERGRGTIAGARRKVREWLEPRMITLQVHDTSPDVLGRWVEQVRSFGPSHFYGYGSVLTMFANYLNRNGLTIEGIRGIASTAETLLPRARELLRHVVPGAPIIDIYGSREVPGVAAECEHGVMHINSDLVHVEFLPDRDQPGHHRMVLTALDNSVFPFIRYDIGDEGSPMDGPCPCGRSFPTLRFGVGRVVASFITPEGRIIYPAFLEDLMCCIRGVHKYQFLQKTEREIIVSVVPCEGFDDSSRRQLQDLQGEVHRHFSPLTHIEVRLVEDIPRTAAGKHRYLVSLVRNPVLAEDIGATAR